MNTTNIGEDAANGAMGEREAFEVHWCRDVPSMFLASALAEAKANRDGERYKRDEVQWAWEAWQARAALTAEKVAQAEPVADPKHDLHARMKIAREAGLQLRIDGKFGSDHYHSVTGSWPAVCRFAWALYNAAPQPAQTQVAQAEPAAKTDAEALYEAWQTTLDHIDAQRENAPQPAQTVRALPSYAFLVTEQESLNDLSPIEVLHGVPAKERTEIKPCQQRMLDYPAGERYRKVETLLRLEMLEQAAQS